MKAKYRLFVRSGLYYSFDRANGKRESLKTTDRQEALRLLQAKNESFQQPSLNRELAKTYLAASDPISVQRTWNDVFVSITNTKTGENQDRWTRAAKDPAFECLKSLKLFETTADNFLLVLKQGGVATNVFLRRLHNFALDLDWIPRPILCKCPLIRIYLHRPEKGRIRAVRRSDRNQQPRRYSTRAERREMVEQFRNSGLTSADFAAEHGLTLSTLMRWLRDTPGRQSEDQRQADTAEVQFHSLPFPAATAWTAEVQLPNGATVRLHANTTPELAAAILRTSR